MRQRNAYLSSSDAAFDNRYQASAEWPRVKACHAPDRMKATLATPSPLPRKAHCSAVYTKNLSAKEISCDASDLASGPVSSTGEFAALSREQSFSILPFDFVHELGVFVVEAQNAIEIG